MKTTSSKFGEVEVTRRYTFRCDSCDMGDGRKTEMLAQAEDFKSAVDTARASGWKIGFGSLDRSFISFRSIKEVKCPSCMKKIRRNLNEKERKMKPNDITIYDMAQFEHDFELFVDMYEAKMKGEHHV